MEMTEKQQIDDFRISTQNESFYTMTPAYIDKIDLIEHLDNGNSWTLDADCKRVYNYLCAYGYNYGYNSIWPTQDKISYDLCIKDRTLKRKIKTLKECGLIRVKTFSIGNKKDKNIYKVLKPNMIPRVRFVDQRGEVLQGKLYKFDPSIFNKDKNLTIKRDINFEIIQAASIDIDNEKPTMIYTEDQ